MAAGDLTTLSNALGWLGLTADDANSTIARLISAISEQIQQFLSRRIATASYSKSFNGRGGRVLMLPDTPVTAVMSLTIAGEAIPARTGRTPGYVFDDRAVYLDAPYCFSRGAQNVAVAYTAGFAATPPDIERACLEWIKIAFEAKDRAADVLMQRAGDTEVRYGGGTTKLTGDVIPVPSQIFAILAPYCRVVPV